MTPGKCLRYVANGSCMVEQCHENGVTCDCSGTNLCKIVSCSYNVTGSGSLTSSLQLGSEVSCVPAQNAQCVRKIGEVPIDIDALEPEPLDYRQLQFGPSSFDNMFNLSNFVDTNDIINLDASMHGRWESYNSLRSRYIHVRMYESSDGSEMFLCSIYNAFHRAGDGLGAAQVRVDIEALDGQTLAWKACDDPEECLGTSGTTLTGFHDFLDDVSDGWCVSPIDRSGNGIRVTYTNVNNMRGVILQSPAFQVKYDWGNPPDHGLSGTVDANGLSVDGSASFIVNLRGIPVPL